MPLEPGGAMPQTETVDRVIQVGVTARERKAQMSIFSQRSKFSNWTGAISKRIDLSRASRAIHEAVQHVG